MSENHSQPAVLRTLLTGQYLASLATTGVHSPYNSLIAFAVSEDLMHLYFATGKSTRKAANLRHNERVALLIDNRKNEPADFVDALAVTVRGRAHLMADEKRHAAAILYLQRFPHLQTFIDSPNCDLYEVEVEHYLVVSRFQNVTEYWPRGLDVPVD